MAGASALTILTGCAAATDGSGTGGTAAYSPGGGMVTGRLIMEGGPLGPGGQQPKARPIPGLVEFRAHHRVVRVRVGLSGRFAVTLPPGTYQVTGRSPRITEVSSTAPGGRGRVLPCTQPLSVTVTPGGSAGISLACIVP